MAFFGESQKTPAELVNALKDAINLLQLGDKDDEKAQDDIRTNLGLIKNILYSKADAKPPIKYDYDIIELLEEFNNSNLLLLLIKNLNRIDFASKMYVVQIFNNVLRIQIGTRSPAAEYIRTKPEILSILMTSYEHREIALHCGMILRRCARKKELAKIMLHSDEFFNFFFYVQISAFEVASNAFSSFRELLTRHKILCAEFLEANYDNFFQHYQSLLKSDNYATKRLSLKLLAELLEDRHNLNVMTKYVSDPENLKLIIQKLKEKARQYEAVRVLKVFAANPNKPESVMHILARNQTMVDGFLGKKIEQKTSI